ncbi:pitrilysin family protein [Lentilactobacillus sp. Marseille-Q4993]|uniref:EF-P 5-aminopentanol modification-associated protein YfmF n=1 Tax=Lentilactobacillus sp. Marseille-Q4993 TaxID=3039492 RepID=UPI0024BC1A7F|nr:pitrilysin family protein [Lentilactobacillus sp. Marseille-Q4993]
MNINIVDGVKLITHKTEKFKNSKVSIYFNTKSDSSRYSELALLAELIGNGTKQYDSEMKVSRKLSELYGASFGVTVLRYGDVHTLRVRITFANDDYLPTQASLNELVFEFLNEVINRPLITNGQFDQSFFDLHKKNLLNYMDSIKDNKDYYSTIKLQETYYQDDKNHGTFLYGTVSDLQKLTAKSLADTYDFLMKNAAVTVVAAGDFDDDSTFDQVKRIFAGRGHQAEINKPYVTVTSVDSIINKEQQVHASQSVYMLGYEFPVYYPDEDYAAAIVMNQVLGGSTQSLLFNDVREKQSLAYDISSTYNSLTGMLTIATGIDKQNKEKVKRSIEDQIQKIINGDFSDKILAGIKTSVLDQRKSESDFLSSVMERQFIEELTNYSVSSEEYAKMINQVDKAAISRVAGKLKLRATFALTGED